MGPSAPSPSSAWILPFAFCAFKSDFDPSAYEPQQAGRRDLFFFFLPGERSWSGSVGGFTGAGSGRGRVSAATRPERSTRQGSGTGHKKTKKRLEGGASSLVFSSAAGKFAALGSFSLDELKQGSKPALCDSSAAPVYNLTLFPPLVHIFGRWCRSSSLR